MYSTQAALIVIDMQNGFINDQSPHVIPKFVELVERWEATDRPVVFTRYHDYPSSPFERLIDWSKVQRWMPSVDLGRFRPLWGPFRTKIAELPSFGASPCNDMTGAVGGGLPYGHPSRRAGPASAVRASAPGRSAPFQFSGQRRRPDEDA
ncbi:isochorismatase family protein [Micromonospora haikouensis]|uniref:cysteine hydrolase family protein n=1 Tax=Micromonospora haikouensis TaxID=686309 RepID=UPI00344888A5